MNLYIELGNELRALFKVVFDPKKRSLVEEMLAGILETAAQIGGPIEMEAELLCLDVIRFLEDRSDEKLIQVMKEHAFRLEQQTRDL